MNPLDHFTLLLLPIYWLGLRSVFTARCSGRGIAMASRLSVCNVYNASTNHQKYDITDNLE